MNKNNNIISCKHKYIAQIRKEIQKQDFQSLHPLRPSLPSFLHTRRSLTLYKHTLVNPSSYPL